MISGKKIEAIKIYREATGEGLKEAKEAIEAIQRSVADKHPELLKNKPSSGCMPLIVVGVSFLAFGAYQLIA